MNLRGCFLLTVALLLPRIAAAQAFEVATIKPVDPGPKDGRYLRMQSNNRFVAKNFTVKLLLAAAFDLNPKAITGGPGWIETQHFDVEAVTPGEVRPARDAQMKMLRGLLIERLKLKLHREAKEFAIYAISLEKGGPKLKETSASAGDASNVVCTVYPDRISLPARNVTIDEVALMMQRAIFDRPVVNQTGLTKRYDFDLTWAADETQFGGEIPVAPEATSPPLFVAMREQLGLRMEPARGIIEAMVIDFVERPSGN